MDSNEFLLAVLKCNLFTKKALLNTLIDNQFKYEKVKEQVLNVLFPKEAFQQTLALVKKEIEDSKALGIGLITAFDEKYPKRLLINSDPVLFLYYIGDSSLINEKSLAIVGSRQISQESQSKAKLAANIFAKKGYVIVSGLALGTDTFAHLGTLEVNGKTIAVLPSGLDSVVPVSNKALANNIVENGGCIVSEYPIGTSPQNFTYIQRDRIQAALSDAILVIEANEESGTMHAVNTAIKEGKPVYQLIGNQNGLIKNAIDLGADEDIEKIILSISKASSSYENNVKLEQLSLF